MNSKIKCSKTLFSYIGEEDFTKGKEYERSSVTYTNAINENTEVLNNFGQKHRLGNWWKHFKSVK